LLRSESPAMRVRAPTWIWTDRHALFVGLPAAVDCAAARRLFSYCNVGQRTRDGRIFSSQGAATRVLGRVPAAPRPPFEGDGRRAVSYPCRMIAPGIEPRDSARAGGGRRSMTENPSERASSDVMAISNAMVRLHKDQFGRGPTRARTYFVGSDALVCILRRCSVARRAKACGGRPRRPRARDSY
jgi:hypothetical protein